MGAPVTAVELLDLLGESNLLDANHLKKLRAQTPATDSPGYDARIYAKALLQKGYLTPYQIKRILNGRPDGFFISKYRILDLLGEGGMGKVFLAEQTTMKRAVALKLIQLRYDDDASTLARFSREARAVAKLRHPNITQAFDFDQAHDYQFIAMEFIEGLSLQELVQKESALHYTQATDFICQAASGLAHAHQHRFVHRDIKPGNLMVDLSGVLKILDLGLVSLRLEQEDDSLTMSGKHVILGTADYVSPEQAIDSHRVDIRADIYSLGCVLYFLLNGAPPFAGKTAAQKLMAHQTATPTPIQEAVPDVPDNLAVIVEKMMAKDPKQRFQTPQEVRDALMPFAQRVDPPYDSALVHYTHERIDTLIRVGAEAPASTTRMALTTESTKRMQAPASDSHSKRVRPASERKRAPATRRSSQALAKERTSPRARPRSGTSELKPRKLGKKIPPAVLWTAVLGSMMCVVAVLVIALTMLSGEEKPDVVITEGKPGGGGDGVIRIQPKQNKKEILRRITQTQAGRIVQIQNRGGGWLLDPMVVAGNQIPNRGHITLRGQHVDVVLRKAGTGPLFRIRESEGFKLARMTLDGNGSEGPLIEIEGKAQGVVLENLKLRNFSGEGIRFIGARGNQGDPIKLINVRIEKGNNGGSITPLAFRSAKMEDRTRHVEVLGCTFQKSGPSSVLVGQPVENILFRDCTFNNGTNGIRFAAQPLLKDEGRAKSVRGWRISQWFALNAVPAPDVSGAPVAGDQEIRWNQAPDVQVKPGDILGDRNHAAIWAYKSFKSDKAGMRRLFLGADDEITIYVNGKEVFDHKGHQGNMSKEFTTTAEFRQGVNHVWVKLINGISASGFTMHIADEAFPLTLPEWKNVRILGSQIQWTSRGIIVYDIPLPGSSIEVRNTTFNNLNHFPMVVCKSERAFKPGVFRTAGNRDVNPKPERALHDDGIAFHLVPLR